MKLGHQLQCMMKVWYCRKLQFESKYLIFILISSPYISRTMNPHWSINHYHWHYLLSLLRLLLLLHLHIFSVVELAWRRWRALTTFPVVSTLTLLGPTQIERQIQHFLSWLLSKGYLVHLLADLFQFFPHGIGVVAGHIVIELIAPGFLVPWSGPRSGLWFFFSVRSRIIIFASVPLFPILGLVLIVEILWVDLLSHLEFFPFELQNELLFLSQPHFLIIEDVFWILVWVNQIFLLRLYLKVLSSCKSNLHVNYSFQMGVRLHLEPTYIKRVLHLGIISSSLYRFSAIVDGSFALDKMAFQASSKLPNTNLQLESLILFTSFVLNYCFSFLNFLKSDPKRISTFGTLSAWKFCYSLGRKCSLPGSMYLLYSKNLLSLLSNWDLAWGSSLRAYALSWNCRSKAVLPDGMAIWGAISTYMGC